MSMSFNEANLEHSVTQVRTKLKASGPKEKELEDLRCCRSKEGILSISTYTINLQDSVLGFSFSSFYPYPQLQLHLICSQLSTLHLPSRFPPLISTLAYILSYLTIPFGCPTAIKTTTEPNMDPLSHLPNLLFLFLRIFFPISVIYNYGLYQP